jgi:putative DNA primase/helicase
LSTYSEPVLLNLEDVKPEEVRWLWEKCVPFGKVTIFAGDPGLGKSLVALDLAARVTRDGRDVILLSAEDAPADTIRPRLDAARAVVSHVRLLTAVRVTTGDGRNTQLMLRLDRDIQQIAEAIKQNPNTDLVIIDPLSAYLGSIDSRSDEQVRSILAPLADLAAETGVAIVAIKHLNKAEEKSAIYRAGGSIGFVAAARVVWFFTKERDDPERRLMLLVKSNISSDPGGLAYRIVPTESSSCVIRWESEPVHIALEEALHPVALERESALDGAKRWLQDLLSSGPMAANDVEKLAKDAGLSWATVRRAADDLKIESKREGFGSEGHWTWCLP